MPLIRSLCVFIMLPPVALLGQGSLPETRALEWPEDDLSPRLMDGAHRFAERMISEARTRRERHWNRDVSSPETYERSIAPNRRYLRERIGAVDSRLPSRFEFFGDDENPSLVATTPEYSILQVRWPVLEGIHGEGLLARPRGEPVAQVIAVPDADQTPEQLLGLEDGIDPESQFALRLAERGFEVLVPTLVSRDKVVRDDSGIERSDQTHREWIYRQSFHLGRHIIGYEVAMIEAGIDAFQRSEEGKKIGLVGYGEGGLLAFYTAALDRRIDAVLVSGYFDSRESVWREPIYRNIYGLLNRFGDAEVASLIAPRGLVVEYSAGPVVEGHKGSLRPSPFERVRAEFERIPPHPSSTARSLIHDNRKSIGPGSTEALRSWARQLDVEFRVLKTAQSPRDRRRSFAKKERQTRRVTELERHVQALVRQSEHVRDRFFLFAAQPEFTQRRWSTLKEHEVRSPKQFIERARAFRELFDREAMGRFATPITEDPRPRTRKILETDRWTAHDVVLDVWPEVFAWGTLLVPKDLRAGERRPVVVCQHGRHGVPRDTIDAGKTGYSDYAARLAERGFVTFAPHNLYRFEDRYRWLDRKANSVGATLFSFLVAQHEQITRWLSAQPFVESDRIAFYGLSYGGESAMRIPAVVERYALSICSGDFNQWTRKIAATDQPFSFMRTIEWEMPYWNLGQTFDYAEMAYLIFPRPFMVERGHHDLVGRDRWVAHEYAKVRWLYAQYGLADRTDITFFQGGHSIRGEKTFEFLERHLKWPRR